MQQTEKKQVVKSKYKQKAFSGKPPGKNKAKQKVEN